MRKLYSQLFSLAVLVLALYTAYVFNDIYVPDDFEKPFFFKSKLFFRVDSSSSENSKQQQLSDFENAQKARLKGNLGMGHMATSLRQYLGFATRFFKHYNEHVQEADTKISDVVVRIYRPKSSEVPSGPTHRRLRPVMVFYHGGAYVFGDLNTYDLYLQEFVVQLDMIVISVDYRLAPEHPYPTPTDDCYAVTKYVLDNAAELGADARKVIIAGDSAGGNAAAVIAQRLLRESRHQPLLQVLIYPWTQLANLQLPSMAAYENHGLFGALKVRVPVLFRMWYMGIDTVSKEVEHELMANKHMALLEDESARRRVRACFNLSEIDAKYKTLQKDKYDHYETHAEEIFAQTEQQQQQLESTVWAKDKKLAASVVKYFDPSVSPLLAESRHIKGLPKAYFIVLEWDSIKDEGLLYAERLRKEGVDVELAFYENAFHGIVTFTHPQHGYRIAREMQAKLIQYIRKTIDFD